MMEYGEEDATPYPAVEDLSLWALAMLQTDVFVHSPWANKADLEVGPT